MTFYEFFCGGGMARMGLGPDWTCTFANDIDAGKARSYAANWRRPGLVVGDVGALTLSDLPGVADLFWMSPPCQDLSEAGRGAGLSGGRSGAFWPCMRLLKALRAAGRAPRMVVLENVAGLVTSRGGKDFDAVLSAITYAGYRVGALMIDAAAFVPQSRLRVFVIGIDADIPIPTEMLASEPTAPFHPPILVATCQRQRDPIWWRLPNPPMRNTTFADILEDEPTGVSWHTKTETDRLLELMAPAHVAKVEAAKRAGRRMVGSLYRRRRDEAGGRVQRAEVRFDGVAGCLRVPTGGSSRQTIMIVDGALVRSRLLSPREAARLMGLDDGYKLPANYNDAYGLMGDGVVVPVVRHLAANILEPILQMSLTAVTEKAAE